MPKVPLIKENLFKNYDLIVEQYSNEFGTYIEDLDVYGKFEQYLVENAKILDLGAGSGRTYSYFKIEDEDYISITDMLKSKDGDFFVSDRLRNRNTIVFLGIWEEIHNPNFI